MTIKKLSLALGRRLIPLVTSLLALGMIFSAPIAAQDANIASATVSSCAEGGTVTTTIAGLTTVAPIPCQDLAQVTTAGTDEQSTASIDISLIGLSNLIQITTPAVIAQEVYAPSTTTLTGSVQLSSTSFAQNAIAVQSVQTGMTCVATTDDQTLPCTTYEEIIGLTVNGQPVTVPTPVPRNFTIPLQQVNLVINIPLVGNVTVSTSGTLVLNQAQDDGFGTPSPTVLQHGVHLTLGGEVTVLGIGLVNVNVDVTEYREFALQTLPYNPNFTNVTFN